MLGNFFNSSYEIPLAKGKNAVSASWIIGVMIFLLSLFVAAASLMNTSLERWQAGFENKLTIEIPLASDSGRTSSTVNQVVNAMRTMPQVNKVEVVRSDQLQDLIRPWVGQVDLLGNFQLPVLLDVELKPQTEVDLTVLTSYLRQYAAGIQVERYTQWQQLITNLSYVFKSASYIIAILVAVAALLTVGLITRSGLIIHQNIVDIMRLIGANNRYVASQFQNQAFYVAFKGGIIGALLALPIIFLGHWLTGYIETPAFFILEPGVPLVLEIIALPFIISLVSMVVARLSIMRTLAQLG